VDRKDKLCRTRGSTRGTEDGERVLGIQLEIDPSLNNTKPVKGVKVITKNVIESDKVEQKSEAAKLGISQRHGRAKEGKGNGKRVEC
jgi:hypothetical protein